MPVVLGRVLGAHGVKGWLRVGWLGDGPAHLLAARTLGFSGRRDDPSPTQHEIEAGGSGRKGEVRLRVRGICNRHAAEAQRGAWVTVPRAQLRALPEGEFYWHQLVGCAVTLPDGRALGVVRELWETGAHDVLVVGGEGERVRLIPTAREVLLRVDLAARVLVVADVPGLFEPQTLGAARNDGRKDGAAN